MKLNGLQVMQLVGMIVAPIVIYDSLHREDDGTAAIASCIVIALLFIGVSICAVGNAIAAQRQEQI